MMTIRRAEPSDFVEIWPILHEVFSRGDSYAFSPDTTREECFHLWMEIPKITYVALEDGRVAGTYFLKANQLGLGAHVCNAGYAVDEKARGQGVGRLMCEHSLHEAKNFGFKAMQYNFVVSTNFAAVRLWQACGFEIVGSLHKAYQHKTQGYVDVYVMYRWFGD